MILAHHTVLNHKHFLSSSFFEYLKLKVKTVCLSAWWKTSMNVVMNCVGRSVNAIFPWPETSGSVSHWLQRDLKSWPYPSWPIHPVDTYNLQDTGRGFFLYREEQGQFKRGSVAQLEHISVCNVLDVFNHSSYAVMTFIAQLQSSFLREICSQWQLVSLIERFHHLFETTLLYVRHAVLFKGIFSYICLSQPCTPRTFSCQNHTNA